MKKQITVLIANPFNEDISGNDEVLIRLMANIDRERFRFVLALPGESPYADRYRELGAFVEIIPMSIIRRNLSAAFVARYFAGFAPTVARFAMLIRKYDVDVVHANTTQILGTGAAARLTGIPSIYHVHSVNIEKPEWVGQILATWIRGTADIVLANSRASGEIFLRRGFPKEKLIILPNPVDLKEYNVPGAREEIRRELGVSSEPLIGLVGRIAPIKSIGHFMDAAAILAREYPNAKFVIVGGAGVPKEKEYLKTLKRKVDDYKLNDRLIFTGRRTDIPRIMSALDVLALTSENEGFGLVLIEAMAAGKPVVGTRVGGVTDIIDDGQNGYLVPYGDVAAIAGTISKIVSDTVLASRMGLAGRQKVERLYGADKLAKELEGVYLSLVMRKKDNLIGRLLKRMPAS